MRYYARGSGLLVPEQPAVPREVADHLRRLDDRLELRQEIDHRHQRWVWRVFVGQNDRPSVWLFDWRENIDDSESPPLPLSASIVDEARSRDLNSRRPRLDADALNQLERERDEQEADEIAREAAREAARRRDPVFHRSRALQLSRARARARGEQA